MKLEILLFGFWDSEKFGWNFSFSYPIFFLLLTKAIIIIIILGMDIFFYGIIILTGFTLLYFFYLTSPFLYFLFFFWKLSGAQFEDIYFIYINMEIPSPNNKNRDEHRQFNQQNKYSKEGGGLGNLLLNCWHAKMLKVVFRDSYQQIFIENFLIRSVKFTYKKTYSNIQHIIRQTKQFHKDDNKRQTTKLKGISLLILRKTTKCKIFL